MGDPFARRRLALSRNARILLRPPTGVQFGTDATRSGIVRLPDQLAAPVAAVLAGCRQPRANVVGRLCAAGLAEPAARTLVEDLLAHGVLVEPDEAPQVAIIGASRTTDLLRDMLAETGYSVRVPLRGEPDGSFLSRTESWIPTVIVGFHSLFPAKASYLARRPTLIPGRIEDGLAVVGPLRIGGDGPCPFCVDLHELRRDPELRGLRAQLGPSLRFDPLLEHLLAVRLAAAVLGLSSTTPAPGMRVAPARPGQIQRFSAYHERVETSRFNRLHLCPLCFRESLT